ncbi:unnamed protein product [Adineta steineri]|uniref:Uncharacterized protein n=1 Tax=Adineta steineri TaxID=433720 RepID=A0A813VGU8_9BILA|nr:unnamed protein product [Adineta steineri]CAF3694676.1 unnamed protein product [Adineta steineri]
MERLRDSYRGRYRDRHNNNSTSRNNYDERSTRGNYRGHSTHDNDNNNSNYSSRNSPNNGYNYRSSRNSLNSRPILSRNGPSTHYRHHRNNEDDDDYPHSSHPSTSSSSSSNRINNGHNSQSNYYDNRSSSSSSRYDRSSNHREIYPSLLDDQPILSKGPPSYYSNSQPLPLLRDRPLQLPPSQYNDIDQNRYLPSSSSSSNYRRDNSPPFVSSHRNERSMDYIPRNINNDIYMRGNYRPPTSPSLTSLSARVDPYGDTYRTNEYNTRSERYDIPLNRNNTSSRDYPMASSTYRNDLYRSSSNASMQSSSSTYMIREQYPLDINYRPVSQSRDYENVSMSSRTSSMDHRDGVPRNSRDRNHNDYQSSYQDRPNLKRSGSRYNDNGPIPSKRSMRR